MKENQTLNQLYNEDIESLNTLNNFLENLDLEEEYKVLIYKQQKDKGISPKSLYKLTNRIIVLKSIMTDSAKKAFEGKIIGLERLFDMAFGMTIEDQARYMVIINPKKEEKVPYQLNDGNWVTITKGVKSKPAEDFWEHNLKKYKNLNGEQVAQAESDEPLFNPYPNIMLNDKDGYNNKDGY